MLLQGSMAYQNQLKQGCLVDLDEVGVVGFDFVVGLGRLVIVVLLGSCHMELAILDHLGEDL